MKGAFKPFNLHGGNSSDEVFIQPCRVLLIPRMYIIRGACKNDSHFFLTLSFLVSDANDIDTKEEGEEKDEDALSFPIHL